MMRFHIGDLAGLSDQSTAYPQFRNIMGEIVRLDKFGKYRITLVKWGNLIELMSDRKCGEHNYQNLCRSNYGWVEITDLIPAKLVFNLEKECDLDMELGECEELI